ncbi:MAG: methyltransferase domain-containing protein [Patescibacteria group bacterium]
METILFSIALMAGVSVALGLTLFFVFVVYLLLPSVRGAPFVASDDETVRAMVALADLKPGEKSVDLGAGDGKIVIAFARAGAEAHGYEINPFLVWQARRTIKKAGLSGRAFMHRRSFWKEDMARFDVVTLYGITYIMQGLEEKLGRELKSGARAISNYFSFPAWQPTRKEGRLLLYRK